MGTELYGFVEIYELASWTAVVDLIFLSTSNSVAACIFGVGRCAQFAALAPGRGLPADVSWRVQNLDPKHDPHAFGHSWVAWDELQRVNWEEPASGGETQIVMYRLTQAPDEHPRFWGPAAWTERLALELGEAPPPALPPRRVGTRWTRGLYEYRVERVTRQSLLGERWLAVYAMMEQLAHVVGEEHVRLVVWFK